MKTVKLLSATKDYLWGGKKLLDWGFKAVSGSDKIAEAWVLSFHKDGPSRISESGLYLAEAATKSDWGLACARFPFFPILMKLIDSADNLSVQVHPSDAYALKNEGEFGKTEMWYVADCEKGAGLYVGLKRDVTQAQLQTALLNGAILDEMNFFEVKPGDCYFIEAGTLHAIGKGCTIVEIQQNSNLTYRVYDYDRVGADGLKRPLHVEKALQVIDTKAYTATGLGTGDVLARCRYFTAERMFGARILFNPTSFTGLVAVADGGELDAKPLKKGDAYFIPSGVRAQVTGDARLIAAYVEGYNGKKS